MMTRRVRQTLLSLVVLLTVRDLRAQLGGPERGCYARSIKANPNRPTVANPAEITQFGVLEIEYGWDRTWPGGGAHQTDFGALLKFAVLCDVELRWTSQQFVAATDSQGTSQGFGDNWVGMQFRFYHQTARAPTMAVGYAMKIPSASAQKGLGSGRVDHQVTFLASKDIRGVHLDYNTSYFWIGREGVPGVDRNVQLNLAFSHPLYRSLGLTGELYGDTRLNPATPGFASTLWALTYTLTPRLVLDGGIDVGLTSGAPRKRVFAGVTYSIANVYTAIKRRARN